MSTTDDIGTLYVLTETERTAIAAAVAKDRARRARWHAVGNVVLACFFLLFVVAVAVVTKGRALAILGIGLGKLALMPLRLL
jgi:hypothetical protein